MVPCGPDNKFARYLWLVICGCVVVVLMFYQQTIQTNLNTNPEPNYRRNTNSVIQRPTVQGKVSSHRQPKKRLPQCIIIGQRKAGTRALLTFLKAIHPDIVGPTAELHFFDTNEEYRRGLGYYRKQMPKSKSNQLTIEKTPRYFRTAGVAERIKQMNDSIKLILIVRDPVKRMISEYLHFDVRNRGSHKTFEVRA